MIYEEHTGFPIRHIQTSILFVLLVVCGSFFTHAVAQTAELPYPTDTIQDTVVYRYPAPKSIGIYRISKIFNVSQEDVLRWNPQLRNRGPQLDEILLIPTGEVVTHAEISSVTPSATAPVPVPVEMTKKPASDPQGERAVANSTTPVKLAQDEPENVFHHTEPVYMDTSRVYRLAVLLPLDSRSTDRDEYNDRFYDFYTGLLTAVYQAQKAGMRLEIHTYDVPRTGNRLAEVLNDPWLETAHAIIGPAYTNQVNQMVAWNRTRAKWILVPFTSHVKGIENDPYILQFNPTSDRKARCLADTIEQHKDSLHCIYVKADRRPVQDVKYLLAELKERHIPVDTVPLKALMNDSADYATVDSLTNLVILHTDNFANASVILPHVKQLAVRHNVRLLAQDSWVQQEDVIVLRPVYAYFFRQPANHSVVTQNYYSLHNRYFAANGVYTPAISYPRFDLLGYDLTAYLLTILPDLYENSRSLDADADIDFVLSEPFTRGIQSDIHFRQVETDGKTGGWINEYIQVAY